MSSINIDTSNESVQEKITEHFNIKWFEGRIDGSYEVQGTGETLFSIVNEMMKRNGVFEWDKAMIRSLLIANADKYNFWNIQKGDIIKISWNNNIYELWINEKRYFIDVRQEIFEYQGVTKEIKHPDWEIINEYGIYNIKLHWVVLDLPIRSRKNAENTIKLVKKIIEIYNNSRNKWQEFYAAEDHQTKWSYDASINLHIRDKSFPLKYINPASLWNKANPTTMLFEKTFKENIWYDLDPTRDNDIMQTFCNFLNQIKDK
jgi:hypothetical protein